MTSPFRNELEGGVLISFSSIADYLAREENVLPTPCGDEVYEQAENIVPAAPSS